MTTSVDIGPICHSIEAHVVNGGPLCLGIGFLQKPVAFPTDLFPPVADAKRGTSGSWGSVPNIKVATRTTFLLGG